MAREPERPDPDVLLAKIQAEEQAEKATLRIYLGMAPGVGKTYAMLQEAHRRRQRGTDVVIGFVETHGRPLTAAVIGDLEVVPPREVEYKGVIIREMDTDAVIARHPHVALVDELAHTNVPGSRHEKRYEDVLDLLAAGISVIGTLNVQHIESLNDVVRQITGIAVHETVPDWLLEQAEQVELIDMAPEALIRRMKHGNIYPPEQASRALENFFTPANLTALRDLALRSTARGVEEKLDKLMRERSGERAFSVPVADRVMAAVDHRRIGKILIRRAWHIASALKADFFVVHVDPDRGSRSALTVEDDRQLRANLQLADELGAEVVHLRAVNVAQELIQYATGRKVTHLVIGQSHKSRFDEMLRGSLTHDLLRLAQGVDILVVAEARKDRPKETATP